MFLPAWQVQPVEYGYIKDTRAEDGYSLDALVLTSIPTFPGCIIGTWVLGVFIMADDKAQDKKLPGVAVINSRLVRIDRQPIGWSGTA